MHTVCKCAFLDFQQATLYKVDAQCSTKKNEDKYKADVSQALHYGDDLKEQFTQQ